MNRRSLIRNLLALPVGIVASRFLPDTKIADVPTDGTRKPPNAEEIERHLRLVGTRDYTRVYRYDPDSPVGKAIRRYVEEHTNL